MEPAQQIFGSGMVFESEGSVTKSDSSIELCKGISGGPGFSPFVTNMAKHLHGCGAR